MPESSDNGTKKAEVLPLPGPIIKFIRPYKMLIISDVLGTRKVVFALLLNFTIVLQCSQTNINGFFYYIIILYSTYN